MLPLPGASSRVVQPASTFGPRVSGYSAVAARAVNNTRALTGRVLSREGAPVAGARVEALVMHEGRSYRYATLRADAEGAFVFEGLGDQRVRLVVDAPGFARLVSTPTGGACTLRLDVARVIAGVVTLRNRDDEGPFSGAVVRAFREGDEGPGFAVRADAAGRFRFESLSAGSYRVEVAENGAEALRRLGVAAPSESLSLTVRALASLEGQVLDLHGQGARAATVLLAGSGVWPARSIPVLDDGRFTVPNLPGGVYELRARRDDDVAEPLAPLLLEPGEHREVQLRLGPGATLEGVVRDAASGRAVADAEVVVGEASLSTAPQALRSNAAGRFVLRGLLRQPQVVSVRARGYAPRTQERVVPGAEPLTVLLDAAVRLDGRVVDGRGNPVAGAQIEVESTDLEGRSTQLSGATAAFREALFEAQASGPRPLVPAGELGVTRGRVPIVPVVPVPMGVTAERIASGFVTDSDGRFSLTDLAPGVLRVRASHPAYVAGESEARAAQSGSTVESTVTLHAGGVVEGRALTERGFPVPGLQLELRTSTSPTPVRLFTLRDGSFRVSAVRGRVSLVGWMGARIAARAEAEVDDDAVVHLDLAVNGALRQLAGRVVDARGFPVAGASIAITNVGRSTFGTATTLTQTDGTFDTLVAATGALDLAVRHPDFAPRHLRVEDAERSLRVELQPGATLRFTPRHDGCATGELVAEVRSPCGPVRQAVVHREEAVFSRLCAGRSELIVDAPGCLRVQRGVALAPSGRDDLGVLELVAGGGAEGTVVDGRGSPVAGAVVAPAETPADALSGAARTGRSGEFRLDALPLGERALMAWHPSLGRTATVTVRVIRGTVARAVRLVFEGDQSRQATVAAVPSMVVVDLPGRGGGREVSVAQVQSGSAAERAGVRQGDRVVRVNGAMVSDRRECEARLAGPLGDDVVLELEREGVSRTVRFVRGSGER